MIADCSSLDQMFSHYIPQLFASIFSTLVIGVAMFICDWRMALAVLWVVPAAILLTAGSKKIQDSFGTKNILNKRAVADCILEGLETIKDIKACSRQEIYMGKLEENLIAMEKGSIHSELATGVFVCSAQAFLRLGLATTILTGGALLAAGDLSFLYFLGFLFAAARLYDRWGWCSKTSPPPSTPNCRSNVCVPFWSSLYRKVPRTSRRRTTISHSTMYHLPIAKATVC